METIHFHHTNHKHSHLKKKDYYKVLAMRTFGNFFILLALFMIGKTFFQPALAEISYFIDHTLQKQFVVASTQPQNPGQPTQAPQGGLSKLLNLKPVEVMVPQDPEFSIIIPKIGANSRIIPNVDPSDEKTYLAALKEGVAHAEGTDFPGQGGHIFLFAHSADNIFDIGTYNAVFYLLYKLQKDDEIDIFYKDTRYVYTVIGTQIVDPSEVQYLTRKTDSEFLTLQTCYPPGTALKRLLVFAVPASQTSTK